MTDLRTAAQQALADLKDLQANHNITYAGTISRLEAALAEQRLTEVQQEMERSIESLKAALAQEQAEPAWVCPEAPEERTYSKPGYCKNCGRSLVLAQEQAQPVQEPVAIADGTFNHDCPIGTLLYTAPPKLVPLTDSELMGAYIDFDRTSNRAWSRAEYLLHLCRAIQRALEEKNRGR